MRTRQWKQGIIVGILLLVALWLASLTYSLAGKTFIAVSQANNAMRQYEALAKRKAALEENLAALGTVRGQDAAIRTAFGVARPGEEVIVVVPHEMAPATSSVSWWQRLWGWFK
jgi:hypothetical protein